MKATLPAAFVVAFLAIVPLKAQAQPYAVSRHSLPGGGGRISGGVYSQEGAIGTLSFGASLVGMGYTVSPGYLPPLQPPGAPTSVLSSLNPSNQGDNVTFTASVGGSAPTGTVTFKDGAMTIAGCSAVTLSPSFAASCSTSLLGTGVHAISAEYSGDGGHPASLGSLVGGQLVGSVVAPGDLVIREFRSRGPAGAEDEYVTIFNRSASAVTVAATDGSSGFGLVAQRAGACPSGSSQQLAAIPNGTVIPSGGSYLAANTTAPTAFSLSDYGGSAASLANATWNVDLCDGGGLGLFNSTLSFTSLTVIDSVGFAGIGIAPFVEGAGLPAVVAVGGEWAFVRKAPYPMGAVQDTGQNQNDFLLVAPDAGVYSSTQSALGAPGPRNLAAPRSVSLVTSLADPTVSSTAIPNKAQSGNYHYFRRKLTNNTGAPITKLRLRVKDLTTLKGPGYSSAGQADWRAIATGDAVIALADFTTPTARGLILEAPAIPYSATGKGGGLNASLVVDLAGTPIPDGGSIYVNLGFRNVKGGSYFFILVPEAGN